MENQSISKIKETHLRSGLKAVSWRFFATLTTFIISYIVTGNIHYAVSIGSLELIFKIFIFYLHERIWQNIPLLFVK
jgi:uncharacterized membrane protein